MIFYSFIYFTLSSWLNDIIKLGNRKVLDVEDLYDPIHEHSTNSCTENLEK